jgi:hypothetical protein
VANEAKPVATAFYRQGDILHARGEELEREIFMRGQARGRLSVALDVLTDALVLIGQHGVYCTSNRNPAMPKLDLQAVLADIGGAKELVAGAMDELQHQADGKVRID